MPPTPTSKKICELLIKKSYSLGVNFPCLFEYYLDLMGANSVYKQTTQSKTESNT